MVTTKESVGQKVRRYKGALQGAVDRKMQEVADYGFKKGQELEEAGYPRLGSAAANAGAGAAALGSTVASEGLESVPESASDLALSVGPGRVGKAIRKAIPDSMVKQVTEAAKARGIDPAKALEEANKRYGMSDVQRASDMAKEQQKSILTKGKP